MSKLTDPVAKFKTLSRRDVLAGAAATAVGVVVPSALASSSRRQQIDVPSDTVLRRYMAASLALRDGRILIIGGYSRPWSGSSSPKALSSVVVFDPANGEWTQVAPLNIGRARLAAVQLDTGHVVVLGGVAAHPTASVEIWHPRNNSWSFGDPLQQARYDHTAAAQGEVVHVFGGSSLSILTTVESYRPQISAFGSSQP